jgi:hypothetical protein
MRLTPAQPSLRGDGWLRAFLRIVLRRGRLVLYTGFVEDETLVTRTEARPLSVPLLGKPLTHVGLMLLTMPQRTFACASHSDLLPGIVQLGSERTWFSSRFRD